MMSANALAPVSGEFASWYSSLSVGGATTTPDARYKGVLAAVGTAKFSSLETWIRLAFKSKKKPQSDEVDVFRTAFQGDETFPTSGNDRELQILAAISLAQMMEKGTASAVAALAVTTTSCQSARVTKLPMDLVARAEASLIHWAERRRVRPNTVRIVPNKAPEFSFGAALEKISADQSFNGVNESLKVVEESVRGAFKTMTNQFSAAIGDLNQHLKMKDEELQMLWWLTGGRSLILDCNFSNVEVDAQSLVFARELANLTEILPGPSSIKGILSRAGLKQRKKLTIPAAVNAVSLEWAKSIIDENEFSPVTTPVHFAIARRLETEVADNTWVANWSSVTDIAADHEMTSLELGVQFYRERQLATHL